MMKKTTIALFSVLTVTLYLSCTFSVLNNDIDDVELPENVTYVTDVAPIMKKHCISCHSGQNPIANVNLDNYNDVKFHTKKGRLIELINDISNPMPPSGLLSNDLIQIIEKWKTDGFAEK